MLPLYNLSCPLRNAIPSYRACESADQTRTARSVIMQRTLHGPAQASSTLPYPSTIPEQPPKPTHPSAPPYSGIFSLKIRPTSSASSFLPTAINHLPNPGFSDMWS